MNMNLRSAAPSDSLISDVPSDMTSDMPSDMPSGVPTFVAIATLPGVFAPCFLCGEGKVVAKPDTIFAVPGAEPSMPCSKKAEDGLAGLIEECQDLKTYTIFIYGCTET